MSQTPSSKKKTSMSFLKMTQFILANFGMLVKSGVIEDVVDMMVIKEGENDRASGDQQVSSTKREQMLSKMVVTQIVTQMTQINTDGHR
jgi:hypothetical protein